MKKTLLSLGMALGIFAACTSNNSEHQTGDSSAMKSPDTTAIPANPVAGKSENCYAYIKDKDSILLKLNIEGQEVTGDLAYNLFEKDKNKGTISGEIKGDTIIAEYLFDAEGVRSTRELVLLKKGEQYYEGFGDVVDKKGKISFKNRAELKFDGSIVYSPVDCK